MLSQQENNQFKKLVMQSALPVGGHLIICAVRDILRFIDNFTEQTRKEEFKDGSGDYAEGEERTEEAESLDAGVEQGVGDVNSEVQPEVSQLPS